MEVTLSHFFLVRNAVPDTGWNCRPSPITYYIYVLPTQILICSRNSSYSIHISLQNGCNPHSNAPVIGGFLMQFLSRIRSTGSAHFLFVLVDMRVSLEGQIGVSKEGGSLDGRRGDNQ